MEGGFFHKVHEVAKLIPFGRVTSYGAIANYLGNRGSARMVGWAMNASKTIENIPAHRVVSSKGVLSGKLHFGGNNTMSQLLESEGILIDGDKIINFNERFWDPSVELKK